MLYCTFFISFEKVDLTIRLGVLPALSFGVKKKKNVMCYALRLQRESSLILLEMHSINKKIT